MTETILLVDDEPGLRRIVQMAFEDRGYRVLTAGSAEEGLEILDAEAVDVVVTDLQLPGRSGLDLLGDVRRSRPGVPVLLITAFGTVESAVEALKAGASDYVLKPFGVDELEALVAKALAEREAAPAAEAAIGKDPDGGLVASSPAMREVIRLVEHVADAPTTVLVRGETGVGKEVVAREIHRRSQRAGHPFVAVNCAAIPSELLEAELFGAERGAYTGSVKDRPGKLEVADGGTLFLDEIGDMPLAMQAKLLRVLEEGIVERLGSHQPRRVDVRVVAATHRDLEAMVREGTFRQDLFYRINVFPIHIPPLRERPQDIEALAVRALDTFGSRLGSRVALSPAALEQLRAHPWPGNVRELLNVLERAAILCRDGTIEHVDLPRSEDTPPSAGGDVVALSEAVLHAERAAIQAALDRTGGNKAQAARLLGISVRTLWYKLNKLGLR